MIHQLKASYGAVFENDLLNEILQVGTFKEIPENYTLMDIGEYVKGMPLLVSGAIKVIRKSNPLNKKQATSNGNLRRIT